ncbi:uncharacterized protein LOC134541721 [Bacillus rossius redtenbacheri]|uniref:uncharacterized protein LOC134541721 n=1 Tax=Bacillus rossius redtenbacheri TaxID=93214 RepID=UPI002FDEBCDE
MSCGHQAGRGGGGPGGARSASDDVFSVASRCEGMSLPFCVSVLRLCGAWHDRRRDRTVVRWAERLRTSLVASLLAAMVVSQAVEVRNSRRDLTRVTGVSCILLLVVSSAGKLLLVSSARAEICELEERRAGHRLPRAVEGRSKRLAACYFGLSSVLVVFWCCAPARSRRALPQMAWYPFDVSRSPYYEITYAAQVAGSVLFSAITVAADTLFFVLTIKDFADSITRIKFLLYLTTASFEVFLFCWYGSNLIQESSRVREAAFLSSWPERSGRHQQAVTLVMLASQRPRRLTVGKFRVLSLETFVALLNLSYSLFLVLREVYGRNKDGKITT